MLSRKTWVSGLALIAGGVWIYVAARMGTGAYRFSGLAVCGPDESMGGCARAWLAAGALVIVALAMLDFVRRQTKIATRQISISDRLRELSETQQKVSLLKDMTERVAEIDNMTDCIGREFMKLQFAADLSIARNIVVTLQNLIESPCFVSFTSADLRFELRRLLEQIKERHAAGNLDLKRLPIEALLDRLFERSLEAQDGWETAYEGLIGGPIAGQARERLEQWRTDKASVKPRFKK
jgi:hypothetical protein